VDVDANQNAHSLLPRGWQRSGGLTVPFDPALGPPPAGLQTPPRCTAARRGDPARLPTGQEPALVATILAGGGQVVLLCWEHHRIPALAQVIPTVNATAIPAVWPDDRFDVVWTFTLNPATGRYMFGQVSQQLLRGETDTVI
jgi:hypothetical protein